MVAILGMLVAVFREVVVSCMVLVEFAFRGLVVGTSVVAGRDRVARGGWAQLDLGFARELAF